MNKYQLIEAIRSYFEPDKPHKEDSPDYLKILENIDSLEVTDLAKTKFDYEYRKKQIIKTNLKAFFMKSTRTEKEAEIEDAIKVINEIAK